MAGANRWRCAKCGETFTAYAPAERHVNTAHGGGRIDVLSDPHPRGGAR